MTGQNSQGHRGLLTHHFLRHHHGELRVNDPYAVARVLLHQFGGVAEEASPNHSITVYTSLFVVELKATLPEKPATKGATIALQIEGKNVNHLINTLRQMRVKFDSSKVGSTGKGPVFFQFTVDGTDPHTDEPCQDVVEFHSVI